MNFDDLDIQEKGIVVFDKGEFIAVREYYNHRVCLYSVAGFFDEVHYWLKINNNNLETSFFSF